MIHQKFKSLLPKIGFIDWPITKNQVSNVKHVEHGADVGFPFDPPMEYVIGGLWAKNMG